MIKQVLRFGLAAGASLALMGGVASAGSTINTTGPKSVNVIVNSTNNKKGCKVTNKNKVGVLNANAQKAKTGSAKVGHNTTAGDATSGSATNENGTTLAVEVANNNVVDPCGGCGCEVPVDGTQDSTIVNTGPGSWNVILNGSVGGCGCKSSGNSVYNSNTVGVANVSLQSASSGNATVWGNTTGGSATSGDASNTNSSEIVVTVSNN